MIALLLLSLYLVAPNQFRVYFAPLARSRKASFVLLYKGRDENERKNYKS
jgi:hypothetical protein